MEGTVAAAILAVVHFAWQDKAKTLEPWAYGGVVVGLLMVRVVGWARGVMRKRQILNAKSQSVSKSK